MPQRSVATNFTFEQQRQEINLLAADFWTQKGIVDTAASTYLKHDGSNDFTGGTLAVPAAFTINSNSGAGTVTISGNLQVDGTTTTVNTATMDVVDKNITIAKGSANDAAADGAGITIDSATDITFNFVDAKDALVSSIGLEGTTFLKAPYGQFTGSGTPGGGQGVEINAPDTNTGQIASYDRANTAYKELRVKGSSVGVYAGTTNALVGSFSSTGLGVTGNLTSDTFIQVLGPAGTSDKGLEVRSNSGQTTNTNKAIRVRNNSDTDTFTVSYRGSVNISDNLSMEKSGVGVALFRSTDDDMRVRIRAADDKFSQLEFADDDADAGEIKYKHATDNADYMGFHVYNNVERMRVTAEGKVGIGMNSDQQTNGLKGKLDIDASGIDAAGDTDDPSDYAIVIRNPSSTNQGNGIAFTNDSGQHVGGAIIHIDKGSNNLGDLAFYTSATSSTPIERLRINKDGKLLLGSGTNVASTLAGGFEHALQVEGTSAASASISIIRNSAAENPPYLTFGKSRGTVFNSNVAVQSEDVLGQIDFCGADGSNAFNHFAKIACYADATTGNGDAPGRLSFFTTANSSTSPTERLRIQNDGSVVVGKSVATYGSDLGQLRIINDASTAPASLSLFGYNNTNDGDVFGEIEFAEQESGTNGQAKAKIEAQAVGTNERGADLVFKSAPNTSTSTPLERLRIGADGQISVGSDSDDFSDAGTFFNIKNNTYGGRMGFSNSTATAGVTLMEQFAYWGTTKVAGFISLAGTDSTNKTDGLLKFYTRSSGSGGPTERLTIGSTGGIHINWNTNNHTVIAHGNPNDTTGFEEQNRVGGTTVLVNDESISSAIYMPRQGCLVAITAFSSTDESTYPQPNTSGMAYIDCGPSRNIQIFDLGTAVGTGLVAKAAYTSVVGDCDNGKTTIMAGDTQGTFRIVNRESNNAYRYQITFL